MSDVMPLPETGLTEFEAALLDFEASWWSASDGKETEIHGRFGLTPPRYYQVLNALIDRPEALAYAPLLVKRQRRQRERRQRERSGRGLTVRVTV